MKKTNADLRASGLCMQNCGRKAKLGCVRCHKCLKKARAWQAKERDHKRGVACIRAGCWDRPVPGRAKCRKHLEETVIYVSRCYSRKAKALAEPIRPSGNTTRTPGSY